MWLRVHAGLVKKTLVFGLNASLRMTLTNSMIIIKMLAALVWFIIHPIAAFIKNRPRVCA